MASVYQDKQKQQDASLSGSANPTDLASNKTKSAPLGFADMGSLEGIGGDIRKQNPTYAEQTQTKASEFQYTPGDSVASAKSYLDEVTANRPGGYQSKYTGQLESLYNDIMGRKSFSYDVNGDAMYRMYADRYRQQGVQSMRDTMGQAAANTGGYGSSYAQTAGQGAYNSAVGQLADKVPELQATALQRYNDETSDMYNKYNVVNAADQTEFQRYQDAYNNWLNERSFAASMYDSEYNRDYTQQKDARDYATQTLQMEREDAENARRSAQQQASMYIEEGMYPGKALIEAAGWDDDEVRKLVRAKRKK